ncbi:MAG: hypothetical protein APR53_04725 [Methanoculleus sp. SDB]|nr:MAG: hypothetical protein APR53_04725 [Methanoculleus sp. SDB]
MQRGGALKKKRLEPGFPVFRETVPAVYRAAFGRLERYFTLYATVGAGGLEHLAVVPAAAFTAVCRETISTINWP